MSATFSAGDLRFIARAAECPLCRDADLKPEFSLTLYGILVQWDVCGRCDLVFQNPRLDEKTIKLIYQSGDYWNTAYLRYEEQDWLRLEESRGRLEKIMKTSGLCVGKLLDVGCATGFFAAAAKEKGFLVKGIDPSPELAAFGRKHYGIDIECSILENTRLQDEYYDLITLWGTDSHFLHPLESFQKLICSLKPGGIFCMTYQNFRHWIRFFFPGIKKSWNALYNLTPRSRQLLFDKLGLEMMVHELEWKKTTLGHLTRIAKLRLPEVLQNRVMSVPAISFPFVIARKRQAAQG